MFCSQCGKKLDDEAKFCSHCGAPVEAVQPGGMKVDVHQEVGKVGQGGVVVGSVTGGKDAPIFIGGQQQYGDTVQGDKINATISDSTGVAVGRGAQAHVNQGVSGDQLAALFAAVYRQIEARPDDGLADRDELRDTAQRVEKEVAKGEQANPEKVNRWLQALKEVAPDVVEVVVNALLNPGAGAASAVKAVLSRFQ
jgi:hypothetical protein